jgi:hypothetical protein
MPHIGTTTMLPRSRASEVDKRAGHAIVLTKLLKTSKISSTGYPGNSR